MNLDNIDWKTVDIDKVDADLMNAVYHASLIFERLEGAGRIRGNGHHMAQDVAGFASKLLRERVIK